MAQPLSPSLDWSLANPIWAQALNPVLANAILSGNPLLSLNLVVGPNVINHGLGRMMQGYFITDITGAAQIYRGAALNASTLTLVSNAPVTLNLWIY